MKIPMARRLAYRLIRFSRVFNLYGMVKKLNRIKAPEHAIDPKTGKYNFSNDDLTMVCDVAEMRSGLDVVLSRFEATPHPDVFKLSLYVAPLNHPSGDLSFLEDYPGETHE